MQITGTASSGGCQALGQAGVERWHALTCAALQALATLRPADNAHVRHTCAQEADQRLCSHAHAVDAALQRAVAVFAAEQGAPHEELDAFGVYHIFAVDPEAVSAELRALVDTHADAQLGFVGRARFGWVWAPVGTGADEDIYTVAAVNDAMTAIAITLSGTDASDQMDAAQDYSERHGDDTRSALPVSAASEVTAVFTLAVEDAAEVATWDFAPWLQVATPIRCRVTACCTESRCKPAAWQLFVVTNLLFLQCAMHVVLAGECHQRHTML